MVDINYFLRFSHSAKVKVELNFDKTPFRD